MNQHFWNQMYGWGLALGFLLTVTLIIATCLMIDNGVLRNPFAPFIRAFESHQKHRQEMAKMKLRAALIKKGMDPDYVAFMEKGGEK